MLRRISCWLFGHRLWEAQILSEKASRVCCSCCGDEWAVHVDFGWFRWSSDFERFYNREWMRRI